mmetsp:Transcript_60012/g.177941  ORF Transcript_60012/g.177941 Transcript_60012/m.177941 type:complete len:97 (-) Transcript_60012:299-589(-)
MSENLGEKALAKLVEPPKKRNIGAWAEMPEDSVGVRALSPLVTTRRGVFNQKPKPPEDSLGLKAMEKLLPPKLEPFETHDNDDLNEIYRASILQYT